VNQRVRKAALGQGEKLRRPGLLGAKLGEHKSRTGRNDRFRTTSECRTRRNGMGSLAAEADAARRDPVACQRCMVGVIRRVDVEMRFWKVVKELEVHQQISAVMNHSRRLAFPFTGTEFPALARTRSKWGLNTSGKMPASSKPLEKGGE
jgi:hypothetical protein